MLLLWSCDSVYELCLSVFWDQDLILINTFGYVIITLAIIVSIQTVFYVSKQRISQKTSQEQVCYFQASYINLTLIRLILLKVNCHYHCICLHRCSWRGCWFFRWTAWGDLWDAEKEAERGCKFYPAYKSFCVQFLSDKDW